MVQNLLEAYKKRLTVSESIYNKAHNGDSFGDAKKALVARVLANTSACLNESFTNSVGTQRADIGMFKKFCLDITTIALPNLIADELVITKPMASMTGYVQYIKLVAGSNKGGIKQGDVFNDPFRLGEMTEAREKYTSAVVPEEHVATAEEVAAHAFGLKWTPVAEVKALKIGTTDYAIITEGTPVAGTSVLVAADGSVTFAADDALFVADAEISILYVYDNVYIPQNDLPILNAKVEAIALTAKPRRIAIYFSQMAAFQTKQEMGLDLEKLLAQNAVSELSYEIDTEIVNLLVANAVDPVTLGYPADYVKFNKTAPYGVSKMDHYESFGEIVARASQVIYDRTKKWQANYMLAASDILPVLELVRGWKAAAKGKVAGPYFAGTLNGLKVFVSPSIAAGTFVVGFNGDDLMTSSAIFAPYMAIVPTQLLGYADGGMSQGFSTLYALEMLNKDLLVKGSLVTEQQIVYTSAV